MFHAIKPLSTNLGLPRTTVVCNVSTPQTTVSFVEKALTDMMLAFKCTSHRIYVINLKQLFDLFKYSSPIIYCAKTAVGDEPHVNRYMRAHIQELFAFKPEWNRAVYDEMFAGKNSLKPDIPVSEHIEHLEFRKFYSEWCVDLLDVLATAHDVIVKYDTYKYAFFDIRNTNVFSTTSFSAIFDQHIGMFAGKPNEELMYAYISVILRLSQVRYHANATLFQCIDTSKSSKRYNAFRQYDAHGRIMFGIPRFLMVPASTEEIEHLDALIVPSEGEFKYHTIKESEIFARANAVRKTHNLPLYPRQHGVLEIIEYFKTKYGLYLNNIDSSCNIINARFIDAKSRRVNPRYIESKKRRHL